MLLTYERDKNNQLSLILPSSHYKGITVPFVLTYLVIWLWLTRSFCHDGWSRVLMHQCPSTHTRWQTFDWIFVCIVYQHKIDQRHIPIVCGVMHSSVTNGIIVSDIVLFQFIAKPLSCMKVSLDMPNANHFLSVSMYPRMFWMQKMLKQ